ncbi:hypothetical protein CGLO_12818 [Colletotrichum gloeosporioides Cg-14]|uniref:TAM domain methyltransferase n=1 Tax=Colletotrichum gloeosporioides (strain Cg-14) TaxID=1237896 RepID=T0LIP2_COLGC|nr:hypothetical protein CGLO_12818 [Colletotrichum gloeosporioides Cg-14]
MEKNDREMEAQETAYQPAQASEVATAETFVTADEDILDLQDLNPALNLKMHFVNNTVDKIGWTSSHKIVLSQRLWSVIAAPAFGEFGESGYANGLTIASYVGMLLGALFWGFDADIIGRGHAFNISLLDGKLFYSPIGENPHKIIDVGTGTVADAFPAAEILGIDLSPMQPTWIPPNVKFLVDDAEDDWLSGDDFDFVHLRYMISFLKNIDKFIGQAYK